MPLTKIPFAVKPFGLLDPSERLDKWPISFSFHERHGDSDLAQQQRACIAKLQEIDQAVVRLVIQHKKDLFFKEPSDEVLQDPSNGRFTPSVKISIDKDTGLPLTSASGVTYPERMQCKIYRGENDKLAGIRFGKQTLPMSITDIKGVPMDIDANNLTESLREGSLVIPVIELVQVYVSPMGRFNLMWKLVSLTVCSVPEGPSTMQIQLDAGELEAISRAAISGAPEEVVISSEEEEEEEEEDESLPPVPAKKAGRAK